MKILKSTIHTRHMSQSHSGTGSTMETEREQRPTVIYSLNVNVSHMDMDIWSPVSHSVWKAVDPFGRGAKLSVRQRDIWQG